MSSFFAEIEDPFSKHTWPRLIYSAIRVPAYHIYFEVVLLCGIVWLLFKRSYNIRDEAELSSKEKADLIREWEPKPLVPESYSTPARALDRFNRRATSPLGKYVEFEPTENDRQSKLPRLNFATLNFLDLIGDKKLNATAISTLKKYGLGSCGPRGFYGTFDVHLTLETTLAAFLGVEEVALYSYGFSTIASAIPAYAKRTDVIFADEGVSQAVHEGLIASRSTVRFFHHNDMQHLKSLLKAQAVCDESNPKKASQTRRFFVVEGIYLDYGDLCPLRELVELKYSYKVRIILDETVSFGVLGATGRGITEHLSVPIENIDVLTGSLETALGTCGGFCAGSHFVVDHQRLSGQGYCFSASLPPLLAAAAEAAVDRLIEESGSRQSSLLSLAHHLHDRLTDREVGVGRYWKLAHGGHPDSPVKHIQFVTGENTLERLETAVDLAASIPLQSLTNDVSDDDDDDDDDDDALRQIPLLLTVARHLRWQSRRLPEPSIRLVLNCSCTFEELNHLCCVLAKVGNSMLSSSTAA